MSAPYCLPYSRSEQAKGLASPANAVVGVVVAIVVVVVVGVVVDAVASKGREEWSDEWLPLDGSPTPRHPLSSRRMIIDIAIKTPRYYFESFARFLIRMALSVFVDQSIDGRSNGGMSPDTYER